MKGNLSDAKRFLGSASGAGDAVKYNKGILAIQEGNYSQAISNFSGENTVNAALAKLLNGDANGAKTILDNAGDDSAVAHYVMAICYAHVGNDAEAKRTATSPSRRTPDCPARPAPTSSSATSTDHAADCIQKAPAASADRGFFHEVIAAPNGPGGQAFIQRWAGRAHRPEGLPADHARRHGHVEAVLDPELGNLQHAIHGTQHRPRAPADLVAQHHRPALASGWRPLVQTRGGRRLLEGEHLHTLRLQAPDGGHRVLDGRATRRGRWPRGPS